MEVQKSKPRALGHNHTQPRTWLPVSPTTGSSTNCRGQTCETDGNEEI
jgi:hypothetical protein